MDLHSMIDCNPLLLVSGVIVDATFDRRVFWHRCIGCCRGLHDGMVIL